MARAVGGRKKFQCTRCVLGSLYDRVLRVCTGLKWIKEKQERGEDTSHRWEGQIYGRVPLAACGRCGKVA